MARLSLLLAFLSFFVLPSPSDSATCKPQSFSKNRVYALCSDLPHLNSSIHWTYNNSILNLAFVAPPPKSTGWISWAINPTGTGMLGSQALLAYRDSNGSVFVQTYNISTYEVVASKIAYEVSEKEAEYSDGVLKLYATLSLPDGLTNVHQVWQVGPGMNGSNPQRHAFEYDNLHSNTTLDLLSSSNNTGSNSSGSGNSSSEAPPVLIPFFSSQPLILLLALVSLLLLV